jgi:hypothetical protein
MSEALRYRSSGERTYFILILVLTLILGYTQFTQKSTPLFSGTPSIPKDFFFAALLGWLLTTIMTASDPLSSVSKTQHSSAPSADYDRSIIRDVPRRVGRGLVRKAGSIGQDQRACRGGQIKDSGNDFTREGALECISLPIHPDKVPVIIQGEGVLEITESGVMSGGGDERGDGGAVM